MASSINATEQNFQKEPGREMCHSGLDTELEWEFRQILQASVSPPVKTSKGLAALIASHWRQKGHVTQSPTILFILSSSEVTPNCQQRHLPSPITMPRLSELGPIFRAHLCQAGGSRLLIGASSHSQ